MSILDTLAARLGYAKAQTPARAAPAEMLTMADGYRWDMPSALTAEKQLQLYALVTWIGTAIDIPAAIAADGVYRVRRIAGEAGGADDEAIVNHPLELLLDRPNPGQSKGEFLRDAYTMYKATGNLYIFKNAPSETAPPDELWIVPSHMIRPIPDGRSYIAGYEFTPPGQRAEFIPAWKISHQKTSNPLNPFIGLSPLQSLVLDAFGDLAQQKWNLAHFDKNNARLPSILAFKAMVPDPEWKRLQKARDEEWGGTNHSGVTLLRGVGDSLQLIQASATQKDMEFLAGRNFTKEEIYGKLAPGLASILAVNATEANAIAGKATLIEFGVWPFLVQLQAKLNSDVLVLFGENLRGEFDDIRQSNRLLDLQEQAEYAKYHTVNEVRAEYYDEGDLELPADVIAAMPEKPPSTLDPRGFLFPVQINAQTPSPKFDKPEPEPEPMVAQPAAPEPPDISDAPDDAEMMAQQQAEMKAWERWAAKRLGKPAGREFEPRVIPLFQAARIKSALAAATTPAEVRAVFERETAAGDAVLAQAVAELRRFNDLTSA